MFFLQIAICGWAVRGEGNGGRGGLTEVLFWHYQCSELSFRGCFFFRIAICGWAVRAEGNGGRGGVKEVCGGTINVLSCSFMRDLGGWYVIV